MKQGTKLEREGNYYTCCPHCQHEQKRALWSIAHYNVDQEVTCEECQRPYSIPRDRS